MSLGGGANTSVDNAVRNSIADGVSYAIAAGNGNIVEINLGSDALVRPGLTFTVLPSDYPEKGRQSPVRDRALPGP